jgi:hypothetical protein
MSQPIDLDAFRQQRAADAIAGVSIEQMIDPEFDFRSFYRVTSVNREAVQSLTLGMIAEAESMGNGYGQPVEFWQEYGRWISLIEIIVRPD